MQKHTQNTTKKNILNTKNKINYVCINWSRILQAKQEKSSKKKKTKKPAAAFVCQSISVFFSSSSSSVFFFFDTTIVIKCRDKKNIKHKT